MSEKKVIVFIAEGPSDEAALGTIMKEYFSSNEIQFVVVHGDITLQDYVSPGSILAKIDDQIENVKRKYRYNQDDIIKIIHITDMDGVYIPDADVKKAETTAVQYYEDHIDAPNVEYPIRLWPPQAHIKKTGIILKRAEIPCRDIPICI